MLLVDPLAALLKPALAGNAPLHPDTTHVDVSVVPPMANIVVERHFTNRTDRLVEAVLTLPQLAPQEVVYRMFVTIGRRHHVEAVPRSAGHARHAHDAAIHEGRVAILYELLDHDVPLISISGIEPGEKVQVQIWSIKPLSRPEKDRATLSIALGAGRDFPRHGLSEADAPVVSGDYQSGTLVVHTAETIQATFRPWNDLPEILPNHAKRVFDCGVPIVLDIIALEGDDLDHSAWQVDRPGGWEVTRERGLETFRHPMNPEGSVGSDRTDWIFGIVKTGDGEIRVTAPVSSEEIAPNARAFRAFAAAGFVASATPRDPEAVRREANILSSRTSLVFIGPEGELPDEFPILRKLALPATHERGWEAAGPQQLPPEPIPVEPPPAPWLPEDKKVGPPLPPFEGESIKPGARPLRHHWLSWAPVALVALVIVAAFQSISLPPIPTLAAFVVLMVLSAIRFLPREGSPALRRLPLLAILLVPWVVSLLAEPVADYVTNGRGIVIADRIIALHYGLLVVSAALPLVLLPAMRELRRVTLILGILNFVLTFLATSIGIIMLTPGS